MTNKGTIPEVEPLPFWWDGDESKLPPGLYVTGQERLAAFCDLMLGECYPEVRQRLMLAIAPPARSSPRRPRRPRSLPACGRIPPHPILGDPSGGSHPVGDAAGVNVERRWNIPVNAEGAIRVRPHSNPGFSRCFVHLARKAKK